jgi:L,D-transpeptidase ErfK/SrfK
MYPEDIERLFDRISVSTTVNIVNQPVKVGWLADTLYLEVHPALEEDRVQQRDPFDVAVELIQRATQERPVNVDDALVRKVVGEQRGVPIAVSIQVWENEVHTIEAASDAPGTGS